MTEKDYLKYYNIRTMILSRSRWDNVSTLNIFPDWIEILVPQSEKEKYSSRYQNPIITIPDKCEGLGKVRNWVLDNFKENIIIMLDDDLLNLYCLTGELSRPIKDKDESVQILINIAVMANDLEVHCFGISQTDIRKYCACDPFNFNGWVGGIIGVIGRKHRFRDDKFKVDIDFCMKNLLADRIIFVDSRYYCVQCRDNNKGGNSIFRTDEKYNKSLESLVSKWSPWIKPIERKGQISLRTKVKRRQSYKL